MSKVITVFGASGRQGGAVAWALVKDGQFKVRAAVRKPCAASQSLDGAGVEVVTANYNDKKSLEAALDGAFGCFIVTSTDFTNPDCLNQEIMEGKHVADACKAKGVQHVVFSSQLSSREIVGIEARQLDAKAAIDTYMKNLGLPLTGLVVPFYYENLFGLFTPEKVGRNEWRLRIPAIGHGIFDIICVQDIGPIVREIFRTHDFIGKTVHPAGDKKNVAEIADILSKILHPKLFKDGQMTYNEFKSLPFKGATDIANQFYFISKHFQCGDLEYTASLNPTVNSFEKWVQLNKDMLQEKFQ